MVKRMPCMHKIVGSIPIVSKKHPQTAQVFACVLNNSMDKTLLYACISLNHAFMKKQSQVNQSKKEDKVLLTYNKEVGLFLEKLLELHYIRSFALQYIPTTKKGNKQPTHVSVSLRCLCLNPSEKQETTNPVNFVQTRLPNK